MLFWITAMKEVIHKVLILAGLGLYPHFPLPIPSLLRLLGV